MCKHLWHGILGVIHLYINHNFSENFIDLLTNFKLFSSLSFLYLSFCLDLKLGLFPYIRSILTCANNWFDLQTLFIAFGICVILDERDG